MFDQVFAANLPILICFFSERGGGGARLQQDFAHLDQKPLAPLGGEGEAKLIILPILTYKHLHHLGGRGGQSWQD